MQQLSMTQKQTMTSALRVEYFSTAWMAFEFIVGFWSGMQAGSILLIAFGLDSFLEIISGSALIWRLKKKPMVRHLRRLLKQSNVPVSLSAVFYYYSVFMSLAFPAIIGLHMPQLIQVTAAWQSQLLPCS